MTRSTLNSRPFISLLLAALLFAPPVFALPTEQQVADEQAALQRQLKEIESEIKQYEHDLTVIKGQKNTLQNKISQLKKEQATLTLQVIEAALKIQGVNRQIRDTETAIDKNKNRVSTLKPQIAELIRRINRQDDIPFVLTLASSRTLSDLFAETRELTQVTVDLGRTVSELKDARTDLAEQQKALAEQQDAATNYLTIKILAERKLAGSLTDQANLLQTTKGKESTYQAELSDTKKEAAEIKSRLYQLLGVSAQINFGKAVEIAQWASSVTGVRASFLLAVLTQESNLGKNVGTCNRAGDPPSKSYKVVMKPERDQKPFLKITAKLGLNPDVTPVSCPMSDSNGKQLGWGGAMGPAQFIPSTWVGYENVITNVTGKTANPWDIRDAFIAAALKLKADGAGSVEGEWAAAMRYFSGSTNTAFRFYGDNVVATAKQYQSDIQRLGL